MKRNLLFILKSPKIFFGLFILLVFLSCGGESKEEGKVFINKSVKAHGGIKNYEKIKAISFNKITRLFLEDGSLESETVQEQSFQLYPEFLTKISWQEKGVSNEVFYDGSKTIMTINGELVRDSIKTQNATKMAKGASFVFFQPFKLAQDDAILTFEGEIDLNDSTEVSIVDIKFENDNSQDKWRFYFDDDYVLRANSVEHGSTISLIENIEFQLAHGLMFNRHRKSFFVDEELNKKYLRAEYFYNDLAVTLTQNE